MDERAYNVAIALCSALSGRLPDDVISVARGFFFGGESEMAVNALLLTAAYQRFPVTQQEADDMRDLLESPDEKDFDVLTIIDTVPPPAYVFSAPGPADEPDPAEADAVLATEAGLFDARRVQRAWRQPTARATNPATWVYLVRIPQGGDELAVTSAMNSTLWTQLRLKWPIEVVAAGRPLTAYQEAAQAAGHYVWAV